MENIHQEIENEAIKLEKARQNLAYWQECVRESEMTLVAYDTILRSNNKKSSPS